MPMLSTPSLRDVEVRHLAALRAVAEEGTFGRAARRLGFTQSAISQQISALERIVGQPLFERPGGPRPVSLTPAGELLVPHAVAVLERIVTAESELERFVSGTSGRVRIGTFQSVSVRILPGLVTTLQEVHPGVTVAPRECDDQEETLEWLRDGDLDLAFVVEPIDLDGYELQPLYHDPFVVLCPLDSTIAPPHGPVPTESLSGIPLVGQHQNQCQLMIEGNLTEAGIAPQIVFRSGDNTAVAAMVRVGMGHAVMPRLAVDVDDPNILVRELDPPLPKRTISLAWSTTHSLTPAARTVVDLASAYCRDVLTPPRGTAA